MYFAVALYLFVSQVIQSHSLSVRLNTDDGNRDPIAIPVLSRAAAIPIATLPVARQTPSTNINVPVISTSDTSSTNVASIFPSTQSTVGITGLEALRRGTELVADRIVSALGSIALLIDLIRNTSINGDVAWNNLGSSTQSIANRLITVGTNTASTLLKEFNNQLATSSNPSAVLRSFMNIPNLERVVLPQGYVNSILRSTPLTGEIFVFPNQVFTTAQESNFGSVPVVSETSSRISNADNGNFFPRITTISTTRPNLNIATASTVPENVTSQAETFLENLTNTGNLNVTA